MPLGPNMTPPWGSHALHRIIYGAEITPRQGRQENGQLSTDTYM